MSLRTELEELSPAKLIEALSIRIYEPPLSTARARLREIAEPLRVPILVLDFDTELNMNGMLGFLENSTGNAWIFGQLAGDGVSDGGQRAAFLRSSGGVMVVGNTKAGRLDSAAWKEKPGLRVGCLRDS